jgi:hypothetical protein
MIPRRGRIMAEEAGARMMLLKATAGRDVEASIIYRKARASASAGARTT